MNNEAKQLKLGFLLVWIVITWIVFCIGFIFCVGFTDGINQGNIKELVFGLLIGAVVGYSQWLILRNQIQMSSFWGMASIIGMGIPYLLVIFLPMLGIKIAEVVDPDHEFYLFMVYAIGGLLTGLLQVRLLKSYYLKAGWWSLINFIAWGMGSYLLWLNPNVIVGLFMCAIIIGTITGIGLVWMSKIKIQQE
jgi:hypothetical protein